MKEISAREFRKVKEKEKISFIENIDIKLNYKTLTSFLCENNRKFEGYTIKFFCNILNKYNEKELEYIFKNYYEYIQEKGLDDRLLIEFSNATLLSSSSLDIYNLIMSLDDTLLSKKTLRNFFQVNDYPEEAKNIIVSDITLKRHNFFDCFIFLKSLNINDDEIIFLLNKEPLFSMGKKYGVAYEKCDDLEIIESKIYYAYITELTKMVNGKHLDTSLLNSLPLYNHKYMDNILYNNIYSLLERLYSQDNQYHFDIDTVSRVFEIYTKRYCKDLGLSICAKAADYKNWGRPDSYRGEMDPQNEAIYLNRAYMYPNFSNNPSVLSTVFHESRHAFQYLRTIKSGRHFKDILFSKEEILKTYLAGKKEQRDFNYRLSTTETDANFYASVKSLEFFRILFPDDEVVDVITKKIKTYQNLTQTERQVDSVNTIYDIDAFFEIKFTKEEKVSYIKKYPALKWEYFEEGIRKNLGTLFLYREILKNELASLNATTEDLKKDKELLNKYSKYIKAIKILTDLINHRQKINVSRTSNIRPILDLYNKFEDWKSLYNLALQKEELKEEIFEYLRISISDYLKYTELFNEEIIFDKEIQKIIDDVNIKTKTK